MKVYPVSIIGGILAIVSLALPWLILSATAFGMSVSVSESGFGLLSLGGTLGGMGPLPGGGGVSLTLMMIGVILVLIGGIISMLHFAGGIVTLAGSGCGIAGALWFGQSLSGLPGGLGLNVSAGPSFGVFLSLIAGVIALVGFVVPMTAGGPVRQWAGGFQAYPGYPYPYPGVYAGPGGPSYPTQVPPPWVPSAPFSLSTGGPVLAPAGASAIPEPPRSEPTSPPRPDEPIVCPTCGQPAPSRFCPNDGTELQRATQGA